MAPRLAILLPTLALLCNTACIEDAIEETGSSREAIVNGALASGHDAVVALMVNGQQFCSGTLVTPTIVVTAAHCLPPHVQLSVSDIEVAFGADASQPDDVIAAADGLANPEWNNSLVPNDVGVIALERPASVLPIPMLAQPLDWMSPVGERVRVVGFGITSADGTGSGLKRVGEMEIASVDESNIFLVPGPASTCSGDSGGPLLWSFFGVELLAGIHSRSNCEDNSINERVDVHAQGFILNFIEEHGDKADCDADGLCAAGCASPDPDCPCTDDGWCTDACMALDTDPDCAIDCGLDDGMCPQGCIDSDAGGDPDCEADQAAGGCRTSGGRPSSLALFGLLGLLVTRRRRRR